MLGRGKEVEVPMIDMGIPGQSGNEDFGGISGSARGLFLS